MTKPNDTNEIKQYKNTAEPESLSGSKEGAKPETADGGREEKQTADEGTEAEKQEAEGEDKETAKQEAAEESKEAVKQETGDGSKEAGKQQAAGDGTEAEKQDTAVDVKDSSKQDKEGKDSAKHKKVKDDSDADTSRQQPLIRFEDVGKIYHTGQIVYEALHNVNLEVMEGELVVILGPSGAGKSTLLNLLGGLDGATSGKIFFGGEDITAFDDVRLGKFRAVDVGIVFQFYNLVPTLTAYENVDLMRDLGLKIMDPMKALEMVGLADRKDNFPSQMSGGQQQRISIARAIAKMPRLLLCDEPTGALDTKTGKEVLQILQDQSRVYKKTVVMVTHNALFADIADKVVMVKNGTVEDVIMVKDPKDADELNW